MLSAFFRWPCTSLESTPCTHAAAAFSGGRYLALESLARLAGQPDVIATIRSQRTVISAALREIDVATRKRALDLIFAVCDASNIKELVAELLDYLVTADFSIREELVLKVAILAEKHAPDVRWCVMQLPLSCKCKDCTCSLAYLVQHAVAVLGASPVVLLLNQDQTTVRVSGCAVHTRCCR